MGQSRRISEAIEAFRQGLRDLGYVEGRNIVIEYRWAEGKPERMRELADELVRLKVDVIIAPSSIYTAAAKRATSTIPIVFLSHADPLGSGHVASLARPGGNITGLSLMMTRPTSRAWSCSSRPFSEFRALPSFLTPPPRRMDRP